MLAQPTSSPEREALKLACLEQAIILPMAALILDGGGIFLISLFAFVSFWGGVFLVRHHHARTLTKLDLFLFRWGYFLLCVASFFLAQWIWKLRGYGEWLGARTIIRHSSVSGFLSDFVFRISSLSSLHAQAPPLFARLLRHRVRDQSL